LYHIDMESRLKTSSLFSDPIFEEDLLSKERRHLTTDPKIVFGTLPLEGIDVEIGREGYIVNSVDQTVGIPEGTKVVFVPDNVRPGSHLFTVLSDYGLPVIAMPNDQLKGMDHQRVTAKIDKGVLNLYRS